MDPRKATVDYILIYALLVALQPPGMFTPEGAPRCFGSDPGQTLLPAWMLALGCALKLNGPQKP